MSKWEDTVMSWEKIVKLTGFVSDKDSHPAKRIRKLSRAQAEISFKAGYDKAVENLNQPEVLAIADGELKKAELRGIKKVVDEIRRLHACAQVISTCGVHSVELDLIESWQALKQKWGIE